MPPSVIALYLQIASMKDIEPRIPVISARYELLSSSFPGTYCRALTWFVCPPVSTLNWKAATLELWKKEPSLTAKAVPLVMDSAIDSMSSSE